MEPGATSGCCADPERGIKGLHRAPGLYCGLFPTSRPTAHVQPVTGGNSYLYQHRHASGGRRLFFLNNWVLLYSTRPLIAIQNFRASGSTKVAFQVRDNARAGDKPLMPPSSGFSGATSARCHPAHSLRLAYEHGMRADSLECQIGARSRPRDATPSFGLPLSHRESSRTSRRSARNIHQGPAQSRADEMEGRRGKRSA